jgi:imidazolonepropionase-like amidohydrolase
MIVSLALLLTIPLLAAQSSSILVILGPTLIDGTGGPTISNAAIVIENGKIRDIGPRGKVRIPSNVRTIDAKNKWVIPGLIDAHVHFVQSGDIYTRPDVVDLRKWRTYSAELDWTRERLPVTLARYLASGITGVFDMGGPLWTFDIRNQASKTKNAPHVAVAGPLIATYLPAALQTADPAIVKANTPAEARALVQQQLERHPDLIKVWFIHRDGENLDDQKAIVRAAAEEAHSNGLRVAVHATELETAKAALEAGADILVHSVSDRRVDNEFIDMVKKRDVLYETTLFVQEGYRRVLNQDIQLAEIERRLGDPQVIATWGELGKIPAKDIPGGLQRRPPQELRPISFDNLSVLEAAGVRIVGATDAGNIGTLHGVALHREFELMAAAGIRPAEIIVSATKNAAAVMGRDKELGTLEKGKFADLLILDDDPQVDIKNARKINRVMKAGEFIDIPLETLK